MKELGRIKSARFGRGGYDDAMIGFSVTLECNGGSVSDFWGEWAAPRRSNAKWTEKSRIEKLGNVVIRINNLLQDAKKASVADLVGTPVEITTNGNTLQEWRILKEVL